MIDSIYISFMPEEYRVVDVSPKDNACGIWFESKTNWSQNIVKVSALPYTDSLFPNKKQMYIDKLYASLNDQKAIIEILIGVTNQGNDYIYTIEKNKRTSKGEQYTLTMQIAFEHFVLSINGSFSEIAQEAYREVSVLKKLKTEHHNINNSPNWHRDPYNHNSEKQYVMNISELSSFDEQFKNHPLSLCRSLVDHILKTK